LLFLPTAATFGENTFEEFAGRFHVRMLLAPVFGEFAFDCGFKDRSFVAFEVGLDALEIGDGLVEARELLFDLRDDEPLLVKLGYKNISCVVVVST
jgi:hypothetical protein